MNGIDATSIEHSRVVSILSAPGDTIEIIAERPKPLSSPLVNGKDDDARMSYAINSGINIPSPRVVEEINPKDAKLTNNSLNFINSTNKTSVSQSPTKQNPKASLPQVFDASFPKKVVKSPVLLGSEPDPAKDSVDAPPPPAKLFSGPILVRPPSIRSQKNSEKEEEEGEEDGVEKSKAKKVDESHDSIGSAPIVVQTAKPPKKSKKSKAKKSSTDADDEEALLMLSRSFEDLQVVDGDNDAQENDAPGSKVNKKKKKNNKTYPIEV